MSCVTRRTGHGTHLARMRWLLGLLLTLARPSPAQISTNELTSEIDAQHLALSRYLLNAVDGLDRFIDRLITPREREPNETLQQFFGDRRIDGERENTHVRVRPAIEFSREDGTRFDLRFDARLQLPRLQNRVAIIIDNLEEEQDVLSDIVDRETRERRLEQEDEESAALRITLLDQLRYKIDADVGAKFKGGPVLKLKLKCAVYGELGSWLWRVQETGFYEGDDGFGEKTSLDFKRYLRDDVVFKSDTAAVVSETSAGAEFGQSLGLHWLLTQKSTIGIKLGARAHTDPTIEMTQYNVRLPYRQLIYRNWVYLRLEPGIDFPRDESFDAFPFVSIGLDLYFGDVD